MRSVQYRYEACLIEMVASIECQSMLAAAGQAQQGDAAQARALVRQALDWGVDRQLIKRVLISGVHHRLGRAAAVTRQPSRALEYVEASIRVGAPGNDPRLLIQARIQHPFEGAGLPAWTRRATGPIRERAAHGVRTRC